MAQIKGFKIRNHGSANCDLSVYVDQSGHEVKHKFYWVPREVITKFINAKSLPELKDVEGWVKAEEEKGQSHSIEACCLASDFWSKKDK